MSLEILPFIFHDHLTEYKTKLIHRKLILLIWTQPANGLNLLSKICLTLIIP